MMAEMLMACNDSRSSYSYGNVFTKRKATINECWSQFLRLMNIVDIRGSAKLGTWSRCHLVSLYLVFHFIDTFPILFTSAEQSFSFPSDNNSVKKYRTRINFLEAHLLLI